MVFSSPASAEGLGLNNSAKITRIAAAPSAGTCQIFVQSCVTTPAALVVASMPFVLDREETAARALEVAVAAAADPGVSRLTFSPVAGAWSAIEALT